jgi:WD40 repeat protein
VRAAAFSSDGRTIVSESKSRALRVWDASTGECLEIIDGNGDRLAIAAGSKSFPIRCLGRGPDDVIEISADRRAVAWVSEPLRHIVTHPSSRIWAGKKGECLVVIALEGNVSG